MPPKGRKSLTLWQLCDNCLCAISSKDLETHGKECPASQDSWSCGYIANKVLHGFLEDIKDEDVTEKLKDDVKEDLVHISQSAMQLCEFLIGCPVLVKFCGRTMVKNVWPSSEGTLTTVKLSKLGYDFLFRSEEVNSNLITVLPLPTPFPAKEIYFKILNSQDYSIDPEIFTNIVSNRCRGKIFFSKCQINIPFYGKDVLIEIVKCVKLGMSNELSEQVGDLSFEESYFLPVEQTVWMLSEKTLSATNVNIIKLSNVGGYQNIIEELRENIEAVLYSKANVLGFQNSYGVLLYGAHGSGKTLIAQALANESGGNVVNIQSSEIFTKFYGEAEAKLKSAFKIALNKAPSIIILDNIETLCPRKGSDQEKRVTAALLSLFDSIQYKKIVIIATTNQPDELASGLRRPGRLEREIEISVPSPEDRISILCSFSKDPNLEEAFKHVGKASHGFVGADLAAVWHKASVKAAMVHQERILPENVLWAFSQVQPSAMREVYVQVPNVLWSDIGGQEELKLKLSQAVEWPLRHPDSFKRLGITPPRGILMYGPPGCSKTMIAKALATESELNFLSVKGSDIFSKWVGESEKAVRNLFKRARSVAPAVVFLDEVDALGGERDLTGSNSGGSAVRERVLSQLLTEIDGVVSLDNVVIIAATNRPDRIDKALLRPGRLDRLIYVPLPDFCTRSQILKLQLRQTPISDCVDINRIAEMTEGYSGAEVVTVCKEAALKALEEYIDADIVKMKHFEAALNIVTPRTPKSLLKLYDDYINKYKST
ncbi:hypothetical protein AAG570_004505 [Ranatra chinensis]|uniref:AAA+ ATPase domain-containing protein n=1 Tax=Ranatra chinensis TaxID=642074 RepID=A0ABD0YFR1_9HEMI